MLSAALVAVTVHVSLTVPAVTVLPLKVQVPADMAYVTLPVPLPPVVLSAEVVVVAFKAFGDADTEKDACEIKAAARVTVVV